LEKRLET